MNKPGKFEIKNNSLIIVTDPETDFWQRTYYGFRNENAPAYLTEIKEDFTFAVKVGFETKNQYDQCGIILYKDSDNWAKASIEYENEQFARLGSVATNLGYSDWATTDIPASITEMWYRLSRRGQDFYIENSYDGEIYMQMRVFHMHKPISVARVGVYACSPGKSSFQAIFSGFRIGPSKWAFHNTH
jgi:hypothetical protein